MNGVLTFVEQHGTKSGSSGIVVYWRPGCFFCTTLLRQLERHGVDYQLANIWDDATAAAFVRSVARGHETVPTVSVGPVALVNPSVHDVLAAASTHAPGSMPSDYETPTPGAPSRIITKVVRGRVKHV